MSGTADAGATTDLEAEGFGERMRAELADVEERIAGTRMSRPRGIRRPKASTA